MRALASLVFVLPTFLHAGGPLIVEIQRHELVWSQDELAAQLFNACRKPTTIDVRTEVRAWMKLLEMRHNVKSDGSLSAGLQVREVALTCIEELTGETFYPPEGARAPVREILSTLVNGEIQRFHITELPPKDISLIKSSIQAWLDRKPS